VTPEAVVIAAPCADSKHADAWAQALADKLKSADGPFTPVIARMREDGCAPVPQALAMSASVPVAQIPRRLSAALRIRTLHGTVLRRMATLASRGTHIPGLPDTEPLEEATVLVCGRGRSYPELAVAVGERVGLVGALSAESAARALNARDIDGMVIGDGFGPRIVEAMLTVLAEDVRFRDLPVAVLGGQNGLIDDFYLHLPNLDRVAEGPARLVDRFLPFVRLHAFGERLRRMLKSLDAQGMIDPDTGLLAQDAFWRDLNRAVDDAEKRGVGLSIARFSFDRGDRRIGLDAARLVARLMRQVDFACREADNSIFAVFTETDLRAAHVIARRIASVLKHTMLAPDRGHGGIDTAVTLATLKPTDNVDSLISRVVDRVVAG
jgi:GGDEF domain-containing protein